MYNHRCPYSKIVPSTPLISVNAALRCLNGLNVSTISTSVLPWIMSPKRHRFLPRPRPTPQSLSTVPGPLSSSAMVPRCLSQPSRYGRALPLPSTRRVASPPRLLSILHSLCTCLIFFFKTSVCISLIFTSLVFSVESRLQVAFDATEVTELPSTVPSADSLTCRFCPVSRVYLYLSIRSLRFQLRLYGTVVL
jgi:hypothetical protein